MRVKVRKLEVELQRMEVEVVVRHKNDLHRND